MTGMTSQDIEGQWSITKTYRYVPHDLVDEYEKKGWVVASYMYGSHHSQYSVIMENRKTNRILTWL